ncbi:MAG TPA: sterol desaturase family protein [Polyangiales bacterium]|jgi:sterol desaturase/sphingolipid hydroxylase (fatty acid hydroxylase superfamily)|nr:sterol desaturase family protein [Polyangiales bacterium]
MTLEDLLPILIPTGFAAYLVLERVLPGQPQPEVKGWWTKGLIFFAISFVLNGAIPALVASLVGPAKGLGLTGLGTWGGALALLIVTDLVAYWVHRTMHVTPWLWRWTHQMHHSAERMDMLGASYGHPFDFVLATVLPGTLVTIALGITPEAAAVGGLAGFVFGVFPHLNVHTPQWLGYFLQRPEMHGVHHTRNVHGYNYGNLALSDLLFGTWRNPVGFPDAPYGFWDGASRKVGAMLLGRDVSRPT